MQKRFESEQGVPEIWGFKGLEMILLRETKKRKKYRCAPEPHTPKKGADHMFSDLTVP